MENLQNHLENLKKEIKNGLQLIGNLSDIRQLIGKFEFIIPFSIEITKRTMGFESEYPASGQVHFTIFLSHRNVQDIHRKQV